MKTWTIAAVICFNDLAPLTHKVEIEARTEAEARSRFWISRLGRSVARDLGLNPASIDSVLVLSALEKL